MIKDNKDNGMEDKETINSGHWMELMDRIWIIGSMIDDHLLNHPVTELHPDMGERIERALDELMTVYRMIPERENQ